MENITEKFDQATATVQKRPWAAIIIILVVYSYFLYKAGEWSSREQITTLKEDNKYLRNRYDHLTMELLMKNNIIDKKEEEIKQRDELIQYADSTVMQVKNEVKNLTK